MADQLIFAVMDIAFGIVADRMADAYRQLARLLLGLTTLSACTFLMLPMAGDLSSALLLPLLAIWVVSASVVRAPTLVLLGKRAKAAQQGRLVFCYLAGVALASALSPFVGLWLSGADPRLPFALSALALLAAVLVLLRESGKMARPAPAETSTAPSFPAYLPLLLVLGLATLGFQIHAFVNSAPLYLRFGAKESLPWLMPLLWLGFFAALVGIGPLVKRFTALRVATVGLLLAALASYAASGAESLSQLVALQILAGAAWALVLGGLMERAAEAGVRGAEGLFMGSFFAVTALAALTRISVATQGLGNLQSVQFVLPAVLLLAAGVIAAFVGGLRHEVGTAAKAEN
jgi:hypothetical protein